MYFSKSVFLKMYFSGAPLSPVICFPAVQSVRTTFWRFALPCNQFSTVWGLVMEGCLHISGWLRPKSKARPRVSAIQSPGVPTTVLRAVYGVSGVSGCIFIWCIRRSDVSVVLGDNTSWFPRIWRGQGPPWQPCHGESQGRRLFGIQIRPQSAQVVRVDHTTGNLIITPIIYPLDVGWMFSISFSFQYPCCCIYQACFGVWTLFIIHFGNVSAGMYWSPMTSRAEGNPTKCVKIQTSLIMMRECTQWKQAQQMQWCCKILN